MKHVKKPVENCLASAITIGSLPREFGFSFNKILLTSEGNPPVNGSFSHHSGPEKKQTRA